MAVRVRYQLKKVQITYKIQLHKVLNDIHN